MHSPADLCSLFSAQSAHPPLPCSRGIGDANLRAKSDVCQSRDAPSSHKHNIAWGTFSPQVLNSVSLNVVEKLSLGFVIYVIVIYICTINSPRVTVLWVS